MIEASRRSIVPLLICACLSGLASAGADGATEQEELLRWVQTLRYQARDEQALRVCDMLLAADPECTEALIWRGVILLGMSDFDSAYEDFSEALRYGALHPMAVVGRARALGGRGDLRAAQREAVDASTICSQAIDEGRADAMTWYTRGVARLLLAHTGALQDFFTALGLDASLLDASLEVANIYRASGRLNDALERMNRAVEVRPDYAVGYLTRARIHFQLENYDAAVTDCDRAIEINPGFARAWHNRGLVNIRRGEIEESISDLTAAIAVRPDYASAYFYRGQSHASLGDIDSAREDLERARELDPDGWAGKEASEMLGELHRQAPPDQ